MNVQKKSARKWVYLVPESEERLIKLTEAVGLLNEAKVLAAIVDAGLKCCSEAGNRLPLPLKFTLCEAATEVAKPPERFRR